MINRLDPRIYQITILASLLVYGITELDFEVNLIRSLIILASVLSTQYLFTRFLNLGKFDPKSPLISGLSLCLLLRSDSIVLIILCAVITIASKYVLRWQGKHIFNPTNIGIVIMLLLFENTWVSPGQWGNAAFMGFLIACIGGLVVNRASRSDVTYAFMFFYTALICGRAIWLGDTLLIPFHQVQNGALLIFTFFMISDPKTTPDTRVGRILFALIVSLVAYYFQFVLFNTNALFYALAGSSLLVPIIDMLIKGKKYEWKKSSELQIIRIKEALS
ncbi:MAG: hypothetical protein GWN11_03730 [Candidatus Dadabacteria bacterium]|nr:hypothetical protein [Candidatus Dadabacteria bacterium]NIX14993.1 hypothetical protein [Candidatus Dadabacteria bacterium]